MWKQTAQRAGRMKIFGTGNNKLMICRAVGFVDARKPQRLRKIEIQDRFFGNAANNLIEKTIKQ